MLQHGISEDISGEKEPINGESLEIMMSTQFPSLKTCKAEFLRSKVVKPTIDGTGYVEDYTKNCIEWVDFLSKTEFELRIKA